MNEYAELEDFKVLILRSQQVLSISAPIISYLYRPSNRDNSLWTFPESADLHTIPVEQIDRYLFVTHILLTQYFPILDI